MNSKVIYKFKNNICNEVFIGETKRHFLVSEYEHLGKSIPTEKNLKYTEKDTIAIRKHCHNHGYILFLQCYLKLKESLLIFKMKPSLNVPKESMP